MSAELSTRTGADIVYGLEAAEAVIYAARASGLYRSLDGGATWRHTFASLEQPDLAALSVAALGQTVFVGVNGGVLRSDDAGETWHVAAMVSPPPLVVALVLSPAYPADGVVIAGTAEDGVFVSDDRGETWVPWNFGLIDLQVNALAVSANFADDQIVYAGTESGVFRSRSGGRGWQEVPFPMNAAPVLCFNLTNDGRMYAGTESHGLYVSDDSAETWREIIEQKAAAPIHAIHVNGQSQLVVLLEDQLLRSSDAGLTWETAAIYEPAQSAMALLVSKDLLIGFADGVIQRVVS